MPAKKAIIVGSGVAGMASAVRLAVQGFQVSVFEKNTTAGGKLATLKHGDFIFDYGPSLFTEPSNIEELFALAGENISEYFTYKSLPVSCKYFYEDGIEINAFTNLDDFSKTVKHHTSRKCTVCKKIFITIRKIIQYNWQFF